MSTPLVELVCGDDPAAWRSLGFTVADDGMCAIGGVGVRIEGGGGGLRGWILGGPSASGAVDGIPTSWREEGPPAAAAHPNGAAAVDHVVILTDSRDRTVSALVEAGGDLRRTGGPPVLPAVMAFVRVGAVIVEVAERPSAAAPHLWGLVAVVDDVDALAGRLPGRLGEARPAVQPGRRIVTAARAPGLETGVAFMTPR